MNKTIIYIIVAVVVLGLAGGAYYFFFAGESMDDLLTREPELFGDLDFALAGIDDFEDLDLGSFDLGLDSFEFGSMEFGSIVPDSGIDLTAPALGTLDTSSADLTLDESQFIPTTTAPPTTSDPGTTAPPAPTEAPAETPTEPPAQTGPTVDASTCAQFSAVPSCSYVTDPQGNSLCQQCKNAGY